MGVQTTTNYDGRTNDLLIFQGIQTSGEAKISLSLGTEGEIVTGIQKLAQSFITMLLTERGTIQYDPSYGTPFMTAARNGYIQTEPDARLYFGQAVAIIEQSLPDSNQADETLRSVDLLEINLSPGSLSLKVRITSAAGDSRIVVLPVSVAIR